MELSYIPRKQLVGALMAGWGPVPGHDYEPGEWAFLLRRDGNLRTLEVAKFFAAHLCPPVPERILTRPAVKPPKRLTPRVRLAILACLKAGDRQHAIAKKFGVSKSTVSTIGAKAGWRSGSNRSRAGVSRNYQRIISSNPALAMERA